MKVVLCWPYRKEQIIYDSEGNQQVIIADQTWHGFPLGIGYLGAYLDSLDIEVKCYDFSFHTWDRVKKILAAEEPDILGITCHTSQRAAVWDMFRFMKEIKPSCITIMGGYHASIMWEQTLNNFPFIDYCVYGDGAYTLRDLVDGKDPSDIPNLVYRDNGIPKLNGLKILPMDEYPFVKYELFNWEDPEVSSYFADGEQRLDNLNYHMLSTSRGCYAHCNFCCVSDVWKKYLVKSSGRIAEELAHYTAYGGPRMWFKFVDETLPVNSKNIRDLCQFIISNNMFLKWECYLRGDVVDKDVMAMLRAAGLFHIPIGVESGSQEILNNLNKDTTVRGIYDTFQYAHYHDINTFMLLIVGSIGETDESIRLTKDMIRDLCPGNIGLSYYTIFPGTKLYRHCKDIGIIDDEYWLTEEYPPLYLHEHSFEQLLEWRDDIYNTWRDDVLVARDGAYRGQESPLLPEYSIKMLEGCLSEDIQDKFRASIIASDSTIQLSGYMIVSNDPLAIPSVRSLLDVTDEVIVIMNNPGDFIKDVFNQIAAADSRLRLVELPHDFMDIGEVTLRNMAIDLCAGDWILELDSDEVLYANQYNAIRNCIEDPWLTMHMFRCNQFCGDTHHLQYLRRRVIDPNEAVENHYGWGNCIMNGYTSWNHIMLYKKHSGSHYLPHFQYKFGMHTFLTYKISQNFGQFVRHYDINYCHYSLCQPNHDIYRKFLMYAVADLTVVDDDHYRASLSEVPIDESDISRMFGSRFIDDDNGKFVLIPKHFIMDPHNPLSHSRDFDVMTFHGKHPMYMDGHQILGRRIETDFDMHGNEYIIRKYDNDIPGSEITIGTVSSCGRKLDYREFDMPVDLKRKLHGYSAIVTEDYYTFTSEACSVNENVFVIAADPEHFRNNYRHVVHNNARYILTTPENVGGLISIGAPIEKLIWSVDIHNNDKVMEFIHSHIGD